MKCWNLEKSLNPFLQPSDVHKYRIILFIQHPQLVYYFFCVCLSSQAEENARYISTRELGGSSHGITKYWPWIPQCYCIKKSFSSHLYLPLELRIMMACFPFTWMHIIEQHPSPYNPGQCSEETIACFITLPHQHTMAIVQTIWKTHCCYTSNSYFDRTSQTCDLT